MQNQRSLMSTGIVCGTLVWFGWIQPLPPKMRPKQASSKEFGQAHENQVGHVLRPNLGVLSTGPSNPGPSKSRLLTEPGAEAVTIPSPNLESPKELDDEVAQGSPPSPELADPELHLDHQSLSTDSQLPDLQATNTQRKAKRRNRVIF